MQLAITGGTGFIGRALVERWVGAGHGVRVLTRRPAQARASLPAGAEAVEVSLDAPALKPDVLRGVEAVVHLAGESLSERWTAAQKERVLRSRVDGTRLVAKAAAAAGSVRVLLSASAIGYYGVHGDEPLTEESPPGTDFLAEVCRAWEGATAAAKGAGIRVAQVRLGIVLHPSGGALARMLLPFKAGVGGKLGTGQQVMSWIHRDDVVALFDHLLVRSSLEGPVNATSPQPVTNEAFARALGAALRRPAVLPAPAFALKLLLGEMSTLALDGQRVLPQRALADGFTFAHPNVEGALEALVGRRAA